MELTEKEYSILVDWVRNNFIPRKTFNDVMTSYGLKHIFENTEGGFYIHNDDFKAAMLECGFRAKYKKEENWVFNISQKSPAFIDCVVI